MNEKELKRDHYYADGDGIVWRLLALDAPGDMPIVAVRAIHGGEDALLRLFDDCGRACPRQAPTGFSTKDDLVREASAKEFEAQGLDSPPPPPPPPIGGGKL